MVYKVIGTLKSNDVNVFIGIYDSMNTVRVIVKECNSFFASIQIIEIMCNNVVNKTFNNICTTEGYIKEGFAIEEVALIREHDILFNTSRVIDLSDKDKYRLYDLIDMLKL